tara:strand:- start:185 stop:400 length:216 start_codon:yes stop_codon:yes gene_type:complete
MIYAIARKISTRECHNNEYKVVSLYNEWYLDDALEQAIYQSLNYDIVVEVANSIRLGDSINSNGDAWQSGG